MYARVCDQCGMEFEASRPHARFHDDACRARYRREHPLSVGIASEKRMIVTPPAEVPLPKRKAASNGRGKATPPFSGRVALYARVSTVDKDQDPENQLQPLRDYAAHQGWEVTEYVDLASATDLTRRTAWREMVEATRRGQLDHVLCWSLDRCFRSTLQAVSILEDFEHRRVSFRCLVQPIDTTSSMGRFMFQVLAAVAEMEREMIRERTLAGLDRARREGKKLGRPKGSKDSKPRRRIYRAGGTTRGRTGP